MCYKLIITAIYYTSGDCYELLVSICFIPTQKPPKQALPGTTAEGDMKDPRLGKSPHPVSTPNNLFFFFLTPNNLLQFLVPLNLLPFIHRVQI